MVRRLQGTDVYALALNNLKLAKLKVQVLEALFPFSFVFKTVYGQKPAKEFDAGRLTFSNSATR